MLRLIFPMVLLLVLAAHPSQGASLAAREPLTEAITRKLISEALQARGFGERFRVIVEQPHLPLANQSAASTELSVEGLRHDDGNGRFQAMLVGWIDGQTRFRLPVHGRAHALIELPVLARALAEGEVVGAGDLRWISVRSEHLQPDSLTDPQELLGAEARKRLLPGRVLTARDVGPPLMVRRGRPVRLIYLRPGLRLSALGTAQDDGALGDVVRVVNADSRQQLQGTATGPDEVTVGPPGGDRPVGH
jgi:flagellar basal body P-ring formation protein FlgA